MNKDIQRDFGEQPIANIMTTLGLKPHDLVSHSKEQLTHKMVAKAVKGRRLTRHVQFKIAGALNKATEKNYSLKDLFNY
jgi:hypothetical protein